MGLALFASAGAAATQPGAAMSDNWSGYVENGGPFSATSATFNVPNLTAAKTSTSTSEWVGLDGMNPSDRSLIQAGVRETYVPRTNRVELIVWWEILPALETIVPLPIAVGDRINVSISRLAGGQWQIQIRNLTKGRQFTTTQPYGGPGRTGDWIVEAPADQRGAIQELGHYVPDVTFGNLRIAGRQGALKPQTMVQHGAVVSEVSRAATHGFSVTYR